MIYCNFVDNEFSEFLHVKLEKKDIKDKARKQAKLKRDFTRTIEAIAAQHVVPSEPVDVRPKFFDDISAKWVLLDTGASKSLWPHSSFPNATLDKNRTLRAVNNSTIPTYGSKAIKVQSGSFVFTHTFTLAPIVEPIVGWDWLVKERLDLAWSKGGCCL